MPYSKALKLAQEIVNIVRGESGGNRGTILDAAGNAVPTGRL